MRYAMEKKQITLRVPLNLYNEIKKNAERKGMTMNSYIVSKVSPVEINKPITQDKK